MDLELSNAVGWLASNFSEWSDAETETSSALKEFFTRPDPQLKEQTEWAVANRQAVLDLYHASRK